MSIEFQVHYKLGHSYKERWKKTGFYCPHCGGRDVWVEDAGGDYYEGPGHLCRICEWAFTMPRLNSAEEYDKQRLEALARATGDAS